MFLRPDPVESMAAPCSCTGDLIRATTFSATAPELRERLRALRDAGFTHFSITIRHGHPEML